MACLSREYIYMETFQEKQTEAAVKKKEKRAKSFIPPKESTSKTKQVPKTGSLKRIMFTNFL